MARAPNQKAEEAKKLFEKGKKLIEIAEQLDVPVGTIRSWKNRQQWECNVAEKSATLQKQKKKKIKSEKEPTEDEVESVIENTELTDKQRLFCVYYTRCFNATKAYQKAFGTDYYTSATCGSRMLRNAKVKEEIKILKQERLNREFLSESDIFQKYMDIAFADITDYLEFGQEQVQVMSMYGPVEVKDPKTGEKKPLMKTVNTVRFKESKAVDGTIISEVKQGKDGASIKLADRMKALQWLSDHMDLGTEDQRAKVNLLRAQTERLMTAPDTGNEDGVEIINDADEKTSQDIGYSDSEISADI